MSKGDSSLFDGIKRLTRLFDDVASATGLDQRADVKKARKQFEKFIHTYRDMVKVTGEIKKDVEAGIQSFVNGALGKSGASVFDKLKNVVMDKLSEYREKIDPHLMYDVYTKKVKMMTEEDRQKDRDIQSGNYYWDADTDTQMPTREYIKKSGNAHAISNLPSMDKLAMIQNADMERKSLREYTALVRYRNNQLELYKTSRDIRRKIEIGRDSAMTKFFNWVQSWSNDKKVEYVKKQNATGAYGDFFPTGYFDTKRTMRALFDFFTSAQAAVDLASYSGVSIPLEVSGVLKAGRALTAAGVVGDYAVGGVEELTVDDTSGVSYMLSSAAKLAQKLGLIGEDLADTIKTNAERVSTVTELVKGIGVVSGGVTANDDKKNPTKSPSTEEPTQQPLYQRIFGPSTEQPTIGGGTKQPTIGGGTQQPSIEAPSSGGGGGGPQCAAGDDEIRYNMNTQSNSAFPRRPNEPGAPGTGLGQSYKATPQFTSGTQHDDTGDKFNDVQDVDNGENNLRAEFGEASVRSVIPTVERQIESDIRFDMFDLVHPGFGEGADNKLFLMQERREEAIVHMEPHFIPGDYIGQLNGFNVPPWQLQREMPVDEVKKYSDRKRKEVYDKAAVFRMYDDASTNVLGDDVGYPYTHSAGELKRARYSPFEPVIRTDMDWQHVKHPTGVKLNKLGMRRTYDALREPRNLRCDISQSGGPRLEPRRSLEVILQ